jgi:hypothetical protein
VHCSVIISTAVTPFYDPTSTISARFFAVFSLSLDRFACLCERFAAGLGQQIKKKTRKSKVAKHIKNDFIANRDGQLKILTEKCKMSHVNAKKKHSKNFLMAKLCFVIYAFVDKIFLHCGRAYSFVFSRIQVLFVNCSVFAILTSRFLFFSC